MNGSPFDTPAVVRAIDPAAEVDRIRRSNVREWLLRHDLALSVDVVLERAAQVGEDVAMAEARSGVLPRESTRRTSDEIVDGVE